MDIVIKREQFQEKKSKRGMSELWKMELLSVKDYMEDGMDFSCILK